MFFGRVLNRCLALAVAAQLEQQVLPIYVCLGCLCAAIVKKHL